MRELILYGTLGCHLCEVAEALLVQCIDLSRYPVELIDIADDDSLLARYAEQIPVLRDPQSDAELGWPFDQESLCVFIGKLDG